MGRSAMERQRPGSADRRLEIWRVRTAAAGLLLVAALTAAVAPLSSGPSAAARIPRAFAQTASRIYLPLILRLAAPLPAPPTPTAFTGATSTPSAAPFHPTATALSTTPPPPTSEPWPADAPGLFGPSGDLVWLWPERADSGRRYHLGADRTAYGAALPLVGDWDGDGWDEPGLYDVRAGRVLLATAQVPGQELHAAAFGEPWRLAVAGDWDGRGHDGVCLLNPWTLELRLWADAAAATPLRAYRLAGIRPAAEATWAELHWQALAGDWDGDGRDELGLYDPADSSLWLWPGHGADATPRRWATDQPGRQAVAGDWDGDGRDGIGLYDPQAMTLDFLDPVDPTRSWRRIVMGDASADWQPIAGHWWSAAGAGVTAGYSWPTADARTLGLDPARLEAAAARAAALPNLRSMLVLRHDQLVLERYWRGADAAQASNVKSVSKSLLSALFGIAIADGMIEGLDERVGRLLPRIFGAAPNSRIRVRDLLDMRAGLAWAETGGSLEGMVGSEIGRPTSPGRRWRRCRVSAGCTAPG